MNKKGFTLIELIAVVALLAIVMVIGVYAITSYMTRSREKSFVVLTNSFEDSVATLITDCIADPNASELCSRITIPSNGGEYIYITLAPLIDYGYIENMKNPWNTSEKCRDNSYVIATRTSDDNIAFDYQVCLQCGTHQSSQNCVFE